MKLPQPNWPRALATATVVNLAINGAIGPAARAEGLAAPFNEAISALVRAEERRLGLRE